MNKNQYIDKYTDTWKAFETLLVKMEGSGPTKMTAKELRQYLNLFQRISHHLAYAKTHYPDSDLVTYLNALLARGHNHIYVTKKGGMKQIFHYLKYGYPSHINELKYYVLASTLVFMFGALISFIMTYVNESNAGYFLPDYLINNINYDMDSSVDWNYPLVSSQIMVNNILVSLKAFVYGITLGIGTFYILLQNGFILGSLTGLIYLKGNPHIYWSLILPHGVLELTAIFISGACGFILAKSLLIPGKYSRKHAIIKGAKEATSLIMGVVFMLAIAGVIEGFFTPLAISPYIKHLFSFASFLLIIIYLCRLSVRRPHSSTV